MQSSPRGMFPASSQAIHYGLGSDRPVNSSLPVSGALSPRPLPPHPLSLLYAPAHPQVSPSPATGGEHIGPFQCVRPYKKKKGNRTMQTAPAATGEVAGSRPSWQHAMLLQLPPPPLRPEEEKAPLVATREQQHCQTDALEQESMSSNVKQERRVGIRKMRKRECNPLKVLCAEGGHAHPLDTMAARNLPALSVVESSSRAPGQSRRRSVHSTGFDALVVYLLPRRVHHAYLPFVGRLPREDSELDREIGSAAAEREMEPLAWPRSRAKLGSEMFLSQCDGSRCFFLSVRSPRVVSASRRAASLPSCW
jgi:hypothetical protein